MNTEKFVRITEADLEYRVELAKMLKEMGAVEHPTLNEIFVFADSALADQAIAGLHGVASINANFETPVHVAVPAEVIQWLEAYTGMFEFYLSLKSQFESRGSLSSKQVEAVERAISRDSERNNKVRMVKASPRGFSIAKGTSIRISKGFSRILADKFSMAHPHFVFDVTGVHAETEKAYRVSLKMSAIRTSYCGICGIKLTDPKSIVAGIGPICAQKYGIAHGGQSLELLKQILTTTTEIETWIPKSVIKERISA